MRAIHAYQMIQLLSATGHVPMIFFEEVKCRMGRRAKVSWIDCNMLIHS